MSDTKLTGGCYCGAVRYQVTEAAVMKAQCHCRPCQYISGGGPSYFMIIPEGGFAYTHGAPNRFARPDLDAPRTREFCATCGTHLTTLLPDRPLVVAKIGTLDDPAAYGGPDMAIHCAEMQPFHLVPDGLPAHHKLPAR